MTQAHGIVASFDQADGPSVRLQVFGDEHYARYETLDGYSTIYDDALGRYTYAVVVSGMFVSTGISIGSPAPIGLRPGLRESDEVRRTRFGLRYARAEPPPGPENNFETFGPAGGLLRGRRVGLGAVKGLTILVDFADVRTSITADDVAAMMNHDEYTRNGNFCSVRRYFQLMSSGRLDYSNVVVGPIQLEHKRDLYRHRLMLEEALEAVVARHGVDFLAQFDARSEGIVDAINLLYAGDVVYDGLLWPHNHYRQIRLGDFETYFYMLTNLGRHPVDLAIGTVCHESGHLLCRWPDLYDYGSRDGDSDESRGLGEYCLMSSGNHRNWRRTPSPVCAYLRNLAGWTQLEDITGRTGRIEVSARDYARVPVFRTARDHEYFLFENRSRVGLDGHQTASGLAVYHCDKRGSNEWQDGTSQRHYQCALLQADGQQALERNLNSGDEGDLFASAPGSVLDTDTVPNVLDWQGVDTGLRVRSVSADGETMSFEVGAAPGARIDVASEPSLLIQDFETTEDEVEVEVDVVSLAEVSVEVDVTHTYVGDLSVTLTSPSGINVVLHDREGGGDRDLHGRYRAQAGPLAPLLGTASRGTWRLRIHDHAQRDVGRLDRWRLVME